MKNMIKILKILQKSKIFMKNMSKTLQKSKNLMKIHEPVCPAKIITLNTFKSVKNVVN